MPKSPDILSFSEISQLISQLEYLAQDLSDEDRARLLSAVGTKFFGAALNHALFAGRLSSREIQNWTALSKNNPAAVSDALSR